MTTIRIWRLLRRAFYYRTPRQHRRLRIPFAMLMADPKRILPAVGRVLATDDFHGLTAIVTDDFVVAGRDAMAAPAVKRHRVRRNGFSCHGISAGARCWL